MNYFRSPAAFPSFYGFILFIIGILILCSQDAVNQDPGEFSFGMVIVSIGSLMGIISVVGYWRIKKYKEANPDSIEIRDRKNILRKFFVFSFVTSFLFFMGIFFIVRLKTADNLSNDEAALMFFGTQVAIVFGALFFGLTVQWWDRVKSIKDITKWGEGLSYSAIVEGKFSFPDWIFGYETSGAADFVLEKNVAGVLVRLFQYSDKSSQNNKGLCSVISISVQHELPSFNFGHLAGINENKTNNSGNNIALKLYKEIPNASVIRFSLSNGERFSLSVATQFEIEALQIFSQELVEEIGSRWQEFLIVGDDKYLIAVSDKKIQNEEELRRYDDLAHFLVDRIALRIERIGKSVEAMEAAMKRRGSLL